MKSTDVCKMCTEYSIHSRCGYKKTCKLQKILKENTKLRAENRKLRAKTEELEANKKRLDFPDEMGK